MGAFSADLEPVASVDDTRSPRRSPGREGGAIQPLLPLPFAFTHPLPTIHSQNTGKAPGTLISSGHTD